MKALIPEALIDVWTPRTRELPSEWIERNIVLPRSVSSHSYGSIRLPKPFKHIIDTMKNDPGCNTRIVRSSAQIGKSLKVICILIYNAIYHQQHCLFLGHSADLAEMTCLKIKQIIKASPELKKFYNSTKGQNSKDTINLKNGVTIKCSTAATAGSLRSFSAACVVMDEIDSWKRTFSGEGSPLDLAAARTISYGASANIWLISTPTDEHGHITLEYERGRSHNWLMSCPHCQHTEPLKLEQIEWPEKLSDAELEANPDVIQWKCKSCSTALGEKEFRVCRDAGKFVVNPDQDRKSSNILSFHISGLMSNYMSLHYIVSKFRESIKDRNKLNSFTNTVLGECFYGGKRKIDAEELNRLTDQSIRVGLCPDDTMLIMSGIDMGRTEKENDFHFYITTTALRPDNKYMVLSACRVIGEAALITALKTKYITSSGRQIRIRQAFIDTGYSAESYGYGLCKRNVGLIPIKGEARCMELYRWTSPTMHPEMPLMLINKQMSLRNVFMKVEHSEIKFAADLPEQFFRHLQSWSYDVDSRRYVEISVDLDHYLDALRYGLVGFLDEQYEELHSFTSFDQFKAKYLTSNEGPSPANAVQKPAQVAQKPFQAVRNWKSSISPY